MKRLFIFSLLVALAGSLNLAAQDDACKDFKKMFNDAKKDFTEFRGETHEGGGGLGGGSEAWTEYDVKFLGADDAELVKGPWDMYYTLRYKYTSKIEPAEANKLLNEILEKIQECFPGGCNVYKSEDFNPEEPFYMIGAENDVNVMEDESSAQYPVIRLYQDYNNIKMEISAVSSE